MATKNAEPAIHNRRARQRVRRHRTSSFVWRGFTYDANGNLDQVTDALSRVTDQNVDPLNRLSRTLQDMAGIAAQTQVAYDALNRPTGVTYPTATTLNIAYVYDTAQADCQTGETFAIGRLAKMTDGSGSTVYCYDRFGALVRKVQTTNGQSFTLRYV